MTKTCPQGVLYLLRRQTCKQTVTLRHEWRREWLLFWSRFLSEFPLHVTWCSHLHVGRSCVRALTSTCWQFYFFLVWLLKVKCGIFTCCVAKEALFSSIISTKHLLPILFSMGLVSRFSRCYRVWISPFWECFLLWATALYQPILYSDSASIAAVGCFEYFKFYSFVRKSNFLFEGGDMDVFRLRPLQEWSLEFSLKSSQAPNHLGDLSSYAKYDMELSPEILLCSFSA